MPYPLIMCSTGRTALHWAAAVNNEGATRLLIKYGAQKDAQNMKVGGDASVFLVGRNAEELSICCMVVDILKPLVQNLHSFV